MVTPNQHLAVALALHGAVMRVPKGAVIFQCGERADGIYIVRSGGVEVQLLNGIGAAVWSRRVSEYTILGLPSAVGNRPHAVHAVAKEPCELVFVPCDVLRDVIQKNTALGSQLLLLISAELTDIRKKAAMLNA